MGASNIFSLESVFVMTTLLCNTADSKILCLNMESSLEEGLMRAGCGFPHILMAAISNELKICKK